MKTITTLFGTHWMSTVSAQLKKEGLMQKIQLKDLPGHQSRRNMEQAAGEDDWGANRA